MRIHPPAGFIIGLYLAIAAVAAAQPPGDGPAPMEPMLQNHSRMLENVRAHPEAKAQALARLMGILTQRGDGDSDARLAEIGGIIDEAAAMSDADFEQNRAQLAERVAGQMRPSGIRPPPESEGAAATPAAAGPPTGTLHWIDVHDHLIPGPQHDFSDAFGAALAVMDQVGIRTMIVMPPPQDAAKYDCDAFADALRQNANRFAFLGGGGSLNVLIQQSRNEMTIRGTLRRQFTQKAEEIIRQGAVGFGEIAIQHLSLHGADHPYENVPADHPLLMLLADIGAQHDVPVDVHFDVVTNDMPTPDWLLDSPNNPRVLHANLSAFERLLDHNPKTKICWAHVGSDNTGHWTAELSRRLLQAHPNLYMSLRLGPGHAPENFPLAPDGQIKPEWLRLLEDFPDRFVVGGDNFIASPAFQGSGTAARLSSRTPASRHLTPVFLNALPPELARKIAVENAVAIYKLKP